ncbi:hypothetical protein [Estrella lausannensis]|uniref:Putative secreted protein n=1 Tax=Estrella lausannensis TaxID=483423 RepID=A0A0H5DR46_9BACT|nr:hypothetical protein [Estrella lausannensis]CRX38104.1 putative secreted protein [Estrella lausannensis]
MKSILISCLFFTLSLFSPLAAGQVIRFDGYNKNFTFSGRAKTGEFTFVPEKETSTNWQEALILHYVAQEKVPLEIYYHNFMVLLNKKSGGLFKSKIVKSTSDSLIFEWWIDTDIPDAQHGWVKIFYSGDGLGFIRYTTKNVDLVEKIRPIWENILATYHIDLVPSAIDVRINWMQDTKEWVREDRQGIERYHPVGGENQIDEQVTVEMLKRTPENLRSFYEEEMAKVKATVPKAQSQLVFDTGTRMLYEWWYKEGNMEHHEWVLVSKETPGVPVVVRHDIHSPTRIVERKKIWERILKMTTIDAEYEFKPVKDETDQTPKTSSKGTL